MLWSIGSMDRSHGMYKPIKLVYDPREVFFIIRMPEKMIAIFPMRFKDDADVVVATAFFQVSSKGTNGCGQFNHFGQSPCLHLGTNPPSRVEMGILPRIEYRGFVSFDILSCHVQGAKLEKTVWCLLYIYAYVKNHVKCTRGFIQRKIRRRLESLAEVMQKAMDGEEEGEGKTKPKDCGYAMKLASLSKTKILRKNVEPLAGKS